MLIKNLKILFEFGFLVDGTWDRFFLGSVVSGHRNLKCVLKLLMCGRKKRFSTLQYKKFISVLRLFKGDYLHKIKCMMVSEFKILFRILKFLPLIWRLEKSIPFVGKRRFFFYVLFVVDFIVSKFYSHIFAHVNDMPTFSFIMKENKKLIFTKKERKIYFIFIYYQSAYYRAIISF